MRPLVLLLALSVPAWAGDPAQYNLVQSAQSIANAGSYVGSITLRRDSDNDVQGFSVEDRGGLYEVAGADQWCTAGGPCHVVQWKPLGEPAMIAPRADSQPLYPDFMKQFWHLVLPTGAPQTQPPAPHPMTEDECHARRGEWLTHIRIGDFAVCAWGSNIDHLDRVELMPRVTK